MTQTARNRTRHAITLLALAAIMIAGGRSAGLGGDRMLLLELAGTHERFQRMLATWGVSPAEVRSALEWDFIFICGYGLLLAVLSSLLGSALRTGWTEADPLAGVQRGARWAFAGGLAALGSLVAAALDAVENAGLLHGLEGRNAGVPIATCASSIKWLLVLGAVLYCIAGLVAVAIRRKEADADLVGPAPGSASQEGLLRCDVVMKGGVTSGIVYPRAIARLARKYRFMNIGGASAGAIAATAAAAAEFARANGRDAFAALDQLPAWLGKGTRLLDLFAPNPSTRGLFEFGTSFLGNQPLPLKLAKAFSSAVVWLPLWIFGGILPGALIGIGAFCSGSPAWGVTAAVLLTFILVPVGVCAGLAVRAVRALPQNDFGMCSGHLDGTVALSDWLSTLLNRMSGIQQGPLTFSHLWTARTKFSSEDERRAAAAKLATEDRHINLQVIATSLTHGRPYRIPDFGRAFYFRRVDLERVFPKDVVDWMVEHPAEVNPEFKALVPSEYCPLPAPHDLPVVFAARLSLSFPILLSAVRLWGVDTSRKSNEAVLKAWRSGPPAPGAKLELDACWMSDGGISSNFPIHFFDALVPSWPTFGLDLGPFHPDYPRVADESKNVFLPDNNSRGIGERWNRIDGLGSFAGALVDAAWAFLDNMQARAPGYRDRIARIFLDPDEGGLNLSMPPDVVERLGERGQAAADAVIARFAAPGSVGLDNHRWVRLRSLLGLLDPLLRRFAREIERNPATERQADGGAPPERSYPDLFKLPPSYEWRSKPQEELAESVLRSLVAIGKTLEASRSDLENGAPRPTPVLRVTPQV